MVPHFVSLVQVFLGRVWKLDVMKFIQCIVGVSLLLYENGKLNPHAMYRKIDCKSVVTVSYLYVH